MRAPLVLSSLPGSMIDFDQAIEEGKLTLVGEFEGQTEVNEYALVILAMNLDCWLSMEAEGPRFLLYAEPAFKVAIVEEFRLYEEEQMQPSQRVSETPLHQSGV